MSQQVGAIHYDVTLETGQMIEGQRKVKKELDNTSRSLDGMTSGLTKVAGAVSLLATAFAVLKAAQMADDMRLLAAKVEVAAGSFESGAQAMAELEAISRRTSTSVGANAEVFNRLNQSLLQMGGTQQDTLNMVETLGKAIKVSGASAVEAKSAMLQFGQALGSGKLAGDELRSLMENAPYLMRQLADGIGVPVGALKQMGEEGKLTADVVTNALTKAATQIDSDFKKFPQTIAGAMEVAMDAASRANEKLDELTGTSTALTGVTKGLGEVLDDLAKQFGAANDEAGTLGKNEKIKSWAESTKTVFSYVIDAADGVVRGIKAVNYTLAGLAAGAVQIAQGNLKGAAVAFSAAWSDAAAQVEGELAGVKMRQSWAMGAGGGRGSVNPAMATGKIKAPAGAAKAEKKSGGAAFDSKGYLAGLKKQTVEAWDAIAIVEADAVRKAGELLKNKKLTAQEHEEAMRSIAQGAAKDRQDLMAKATQDGLAEMTRGYEAEQQRKAKIDAARTAAKQTIASVNPVDAVRFEEEQRIAALEEGRQIDLENEALYAQAKAAVHQSANDKIKKINDDKRKEEADAQSAQLQAYSALFGSVSDLTKQFGGEQSAAFKVLFAASKGFAIADAGLKLNMAIMQAMADPTALTPMQKFANYAAIATAGTALISSISGSTYGGRQYGGPANSGNLYRVNEKGAPEMFTAANGSQYMMPTQSGRVTAADRMNSGAITIINNGRNPIGQVTQETKPNGDRAIYIHDAIAAVNAAMSDPNSSTSRAMGRNFGIQRSR